jgi:hypothetical protein
MATSSGKSTFGARDGKPLACTPQSRSRAKKSETC